MLPVQVSQQQIAWVSGFTLSCSPPPHPRRSSAGHGPFSNAANLVSVSLNDKSRRSDNHTGRGFQMTDSKKVHWRDCNVTPISNITSGIKALCWRGCCTLTSWCSTSCAAADPCKHCSQACSPVHQRIAPPAVLNTLLLQVVLLGHMPVHIRHHLLQNSRTQRSHDDTAVNVRLSQT